MSINETLDGLGDRLRKVRGTRTQKEFAEVLGVTRSYIAQIETESIKPSIDVLVKISKEYNISLDWLLLNKEPIQDAQKNISYLSDENFAAQLEIILTTNPGLIFEIIGRLLQQPHCSFALRRALEGQLIDDQSLRDIIDYLLLIWHEGNRDLQGWLKIQFKKAFPDYLEELEKKRSLDNEESATKLA